MWALVGLALAGEAEPVDAYSQGYAAGKEAAEATNPKRPALIGFASGVGVAAASTTLVGPCLAAPCLVTGALTPGVIYATTGPPEHEAPADAYRYQSGYKHGFIDHAGRRRVLPAVVGGVVGAAIGSAGAYVGVGFVYSRLGYEVDSFPFKTGD